jgi:NSS family neurotransmitter:Na+ symporter
MKGGVMRLKEGNGSEKRPQWGTSFGFIMASVGAAVGMGNIWGFPYKLGQGGGFVYLALYLIIVLFAGVPILLAELSIGRVSKHAPIRAYQFIHKKLAFVGVFSLIACFFILCYYSFFGGMLLRYLFMELGMNTDAPVIWHFVFISLTALIVVAGVEKGIEKSSLIMVPALVLLLLFIAVATCRLPGAKKAFSFLFEPDLRKLNIKTLSMALTQVFFSLSLGQGCMITYGSYIGKKENLLKSALIIPFFDTATAVLAAMAIMPAVFTYGVSPAAGPSLMFDIVPRVFSEMSGGKLLAVLFFFLVFLAAITSAVSMLETLVSAAIDMRKTARKKAVVLFSFLIAVCGVPVCLSYGKGIGFFGMDFFELYEFVSQYVLMSLCSLITCLAVVYVWRPKKALPAALGAHSGIVGRLWIFLLKSVTPALLLYVILSLFRFF